MLSPVPSWGRGFLYSLSTAFQRTRSVFARFIRLMPVLALTAVPVGCGTSYQKVEGTVTLGGSPVEGATVTFYPTSEGGQAASAITDANGKFKLTNPTNDKGIPKGTYKVTITKGDPSENKIDIDPNDPTKSMAEFAMKNKTKSAKGMEIAPAKESSTLPPRYSKQDTTPFTITIPADGAINLALEK